MLVSLNFVEKFITLPKLTTQILVHGKNLEHKFFDLEKISPILTRQGFEVEDAKVHGAGLETVVVGRIDKIEPHATANKLQVCQVNIGKEELLQIVCGAANARLGLYVAVALVGTKLPNGMQINPASLRGVESHGMLCSREELGLPVHSEIDGNGIWEIEVDSQGGKSKEELAHNLGTPLFYALCLYDVILDLAVTPNRPDMLCHEGVARELAAGFQFLKIPFERKNPSFAARSKVTEQTIKNDAVQNSVVKVADASFSVENHLNAPTFFMVLETENVGPSPAWLRNLLEALSQSSINQVVDVSNYVLLAYGQPNHPFDLDKISGSENNHKKLVLRHAKPHENFLGLDGKERALHESDCVVSDEKQVHALLGVLGGEHAKVTKGTQKIAIEFANPNPVLIRRTSRRHGRQTEASFMFEKGINAAARFHAAAEFFALLNSISHQKSEYKGSLHSQNLESKPAIQTEFNKVIIPFTAADQKNVLGSDITSFENQLEILESLSFQIDNKTEHSAAVVVPTWRSNDVVSNPDLVEECIRVVGIDNIPARPIVSDAVVSQDDPQFSFIENISSKAASLGFVEVIGLHFMRADDWKKLNLSSANALGAPVVVLNPVLGDEPWLHTTLIPDLLRKVSSNLNYGIKSGQLFHSCRTFQNSDSKGNIFFTADLQNPSHANPQKSDELSDYSYKSGYTYCLEDQKMGRPVETPRLAGVCFGNRIEKNWQNPSEIPWTLHDMMNCVLELAKVANATVHIARISHELSHGVEEHFHPMAQALHPGKRVGFYLEQEGHPAVSLGWCGELHPKVARNFDIDVPCLAFEINLATLLSVSMHARGPQAKNVISQKFPPVSRDFAVLLEENITAKQLNDVVCNSLQKIIAEEIPANILDMKIFDIYRGKGVPENKKSVTFKITLDPLQKTFTDADIQKLSANVISAVETHLKGELRGV